MNFSDYLYIRNRYKDLGPNKYNLNLKDLQKDNTVIINFGLSKEENAIYEEKNKDNINNYKTTVKNMLSINNNLKDYRKIFIINNFNHYEDHIADNDFIKNTFINGIDLEDELSILVLKNSTNAFVSPGFFKWLSINVNNINNYIITGFSLEEDIYPFVITLQSFYKEWDKTCNIFIKYDSVLNVSSLSNKKNHKISNIFLYDNLEKNNIYFI